MTNSENGDAAAASARAADGYDAIADTHPTAKIISGNQNRCDKSGVARNERRIQKCHGRQLDQKQIIAADHKQQFKELRDIYIVAIDKIKELESEITLLQTSAPRNEKDSSWMRIKDLVPEMFSEKEECRMKWKTNV